MTGVFLVCVLSAVQSPSPLIDRLGDPRIERREAAERALRKMGRDAIPDLERALSHPSPEVRLRARALLYRLPEYALRAFLSDPDLARAWNAIIESLVYKRPIPAELWDGDEDLDLRELIHFPERRPNPVPHDLDWIRKTMRCSGHEILQGLAMKYGVRGSLFLDELVLKATLVDPVPRDFLHRLVRLQADETTLEEVTATLHLLTQESKAGSLWEMHDSDWDTVLRFLVHIRRRRDRPAATLPRTEEEAWRRIERGPWLNAIADGLGRVFSNRCDRGRWMEITEERLQNQAVDEENPLDFLYRILAGIDEDQSQLFWRPRALRPASPMLPPRIKDKGCGMLDELSAEIRRLNLSPEEGRVVFEMQRCLNIRNPDPRAIRTQARLVRLIAARVVANVRASKKP